MSEIPRVALSRAIEKRDRQARSESATKVTNARSSHGEYGTRVPRREHATVSFMGWAAMNPALGPGGPCFGCPALVAPTLNA
jgi:hypothetical protein